MLSVTKAPNIYTSPGDPAVYSCIGGRFTFDRGSCICSVRVIYTPSPKQYMMHIWLRIPLPEGGGGQGGLWHGLAGNLAAGAVSNFLSSAAGVSSVRQLHQLGCALPPGWYYHRSRDSSIALCPPGGPALPRLALSHPADRDIFPLPLFSPLAPTHTRLHHQPTLFLFSVLL